MPTSVEILRLTSTIADELAPVAVLWHVAALALLAAIVAGWRPMLRTASWLAVAPIASVAAASIAYGSPFNAVTFAVLALVIALAARRLPAARVGLGPRWAAALGGALVVFGLVYPHFVVPWTRALYAAPVGLIPCPTLALVAGGVLVTDGLRSRAIVAGLSIWTAFYAAFGIAVLGVGLDVGLVAATAGLVGLLVHDVRSHAAAAV